MKHFTIYIFSFSLLLMLVGCQFETHKEEKQQYPQLTYILINHNAAPWDTLHKELVRHENLFSTHFLTFEQKYKESNETFRQHFRFVPDRANKDSLDIFEEITPELMAKKKVFYGDEEHWIYKYYYDDLSGVDEEMTYYFTPEFGILIEESAWGYYSVLVDNGNEEDNKAIYLINLMIMHDEGFYHKFNKSRFIY